MPHFVTVVLMAAGLFFGMLLFLEAGRRIGLRRIAGGGDDRDAGVGVLEGSIFALLGLVIAFSFSGALERFDWRRQLMVEEANDIGTAYLRLDLLPTEAQPQLRRLFRDYVEGRLEVHRRLPDIEAAKHELVRLTQIQGQIWSLSLSAAQQTGNPVVSNLLLPALNAMFDILTTQTSAALMHPPSVVYLMLFGLALVSSFLVGYDMAILKDRHWIHVIGFAVAIAFSLYVVLDLEYPRLGLIRIDEFDKVLVNLLATMK